MDCGKYRLRCDLQMNNSGKSGRRTSTIVTLWRVSRHPCRARIMFFSGIKRAPRLQGDIATKEAPLSLGGLSGAVSFERNRAACERGIRTIAGSSVRS
jgi:hypothetical protein